MILPLRLKREYVFILIQISLSLGIGFSARNVFSAVFQLLLVLAFWFDYSIRMYKLGVLIKSKEHRFTVPGEGLFLITYSLFIFLALFRQFDMGFLFLTILRNTYIVIKIVGIGRREKGVLRVTLEYPALTILGSFLLVILFGAFLLAMPEAGSRNEGIGFLNALFTSTSAVCVTGLIVVDTAVDLSLFGQTVVMILIQIGGLGIMIFSFFTAFLMGRSVTVEEKFLISYMLSEKDVNSLGKNIVTIISITFVIEAAGMAFLFLQFSGSFGFSAKTLFYALFHSISAFCNAGFALFSDSFEGYKSSPLLIFTISGLIILGGISFGVIINCKNSILSSWKNTFLKKPAEKKKITVNTKIVLVSTAALLGAGMIFFYFMEHRNTLSGYNLKTQYLSIFFQSVTLRTAGFNTVSFSGFHTGTYLFLMLLMFIGGASGSTAGGIKVNTLGVLLGYLKSIIKNESTPTLFRHMIPKELILKAFLILLLALMTVFTGVFIMSFSEKHRFVEVLFEVVSAFGTVGLSAGITPALTYVGKVVIIFLMFMGRLGPLTILAAASGRTRRREIRFPSAEITLG